MATVTEKSASDLPEPVGGFQTVADLVDYLGGIPVERILLRPTPGTATEEDLIAVNARKSGLFELIDGVIVQKAMPFLESSLAAVLITYIRLWIKEHGGGQVFAPDAMFRQDSGKIRLPDVSFVRSECFPTGKVERVTVGSVPCALVVEILSLNNTKQEIDQKRNEFFSNGTELMWVADPATRTVEVWRSRSDMKLLESDDELTGGNVLPGFKLPVSTWFDEGEAV